MLNRVVLRGVLARPPRASALASEGTIVRLEVRTRSGDGPAETVPVAWFDPPAWAADIEPGADLVVVGRVRRRFFKLGGSTQSRTEVVADRVLKASGRRRAREALVQEAAAIEAAASLLAMRLA